VHDSDKFLLGYNKSSAVAEMGDRLATIEIGRKLGTVHPFLRQSWAPSNTMSSGTRPTSIPSGILIYPALWPQRTWAENWGLCPFWGSCVSPSNTMWPGPSPICMPSFILIRPTVWPQYTNVTDRQNRTGLRSDSIGRTILQTVTQKPPQNPPVQTVST